MANRKLLIKLLRICISVVLIALILKTADLEKLWINVLNMNIYLFILANFLNFIRVFISAYRWKILLDMKNIRIDIGRLSSIYFIGIFFNMFLPTALGGDGARIFYLWRLTGEKMEATSSVLIERVIGFFVVGLICLGALLVSFERLGSFKERGLISVVCLAYLLGITIFFHSRFANWFLSVLRYLPSKTISNKIRKFYGSLHDFLKRKDVIIKNLILSTAYQVAWIVGVMFIGIGIGIETNPLNYFIFLPIVMVVTMLPVSISGIGVREGAFVVLFGLVGIAPSSAILLSFLSFSMAIILGLLGGITYALADILLKDKFAASFKDN